MGRVRKNLTRGNHAPVITPDKTAYVAYPTELQRIREEEDRVNHPNHYTWLKELCGIEVIDITRHMNFNLGNCIKYVLRAGHKSEQGMSNKQKQIEDLKKARFYIDDEIKRLENEKSN